ncbi:MAG: hypothetical protein LBJ00_05735 [Planctomycetaceae bacterium]|nr:hypothetical protein [Planctomycetaceae bacterium]
MKFPKLNTQAQQREAVVQGRSLSPYRLRCIPKLAYRCYTQATLKFMELDTQA